MKNKQTISIITFVAFTLLWSLLWAIYKTEIITQFQQKLDYLFYVLGLVPAIGLFVGALIFRNAKVTGQFTLFGVHRISSVIAVLMPVVLLAIVGVKNTYQIQENIFGLYVGCLVLVYALMEEYGWRGYLHPALFLLGLKKWTVCIITGSIWYLWHWFFLRSGSGSGKIILLPVLILGSSGLDIILQKTKSILFCSAFHSFANIIFMYALVSNSISITNKIGIAVVSIAIWLVMTKRLEKKEID